MASEGHGILEFPGTGVETDVRHLSELLKRVSEVTRKYDVPTMLPLEPFPQRFEAAKECLEAARRSGATMFGQTHGRGFVAVLSFKTRLPFDELPEWHVVRQLPLVDQAASLQDPEIRRTLIAAADAMDRSKVTLGAGPRPPNFEAMRVYDHPMPPYRSVAEVAAERNVHPVGLMIDLALETEFSQLFFQTLGTCTEEYVFESLQHEQAVIALSDTGAHVSQIVDSSVPTHLLGYWVREREALTLQQAVRMLTLVPAAAWGIPDRGLISQGLVADINIFDPVTVAPAMPFVANDLPAGASRLKQYATGFRSTIVAGIPVHQEGVHTGAYPGQLIRGPFARPTLVPRVAAS